MDESVVKYLPLEARAVLLRAAELIDAGGLCQTGAFSDGRGGLCIMGAIDVAVGLEPGEGAFSGPEVIDDAIDLVMNVIGAGIATWNDAPERTKDEVVAKLRAVALGL